MSVPEERRYYGKYRATVIDNVDPMQLGRIQVLSPDVHGMVPTSWAMPCVPIAGTQSGIYCVPPIGSSVWIEFEQGDLDFPIWVGGFWGLQSDPPGLALAPPAAPPGANICLQTVQQNSILLSDSPTPPGGITIKSRSGAQITLLDTGVSVVSPVPVTISAPTINITGSTAINITAPTVTINGGALVVT
ncbi:MAG TPA: phage baseplate assembly protein V [Vicinamibacteria bacterium]|nr:phage baseplate assembly protein V [Vicinamibacteria bacterium]